MTLDLPVIFTILMGVAVLAYVVLVGLVADVISGTRKLLEDLLYRVRVMELRDDRPSDPPCDRSTETGR